MRDFFEPQKPVAAIAHGPRTLVGADVVRGRVLTTRPGLKTDIRNAGGHGVDEEVHVDQGLVTSRNPDDFDAFSDKAIEEFAERKTCGSDSLRSQGGTIAPCRSLVVAEALIG